MIRDWVDLMRLEVSRDMSDFFSTEEVCVIALYYHDDHNWLNLQVPAAAQLNVASEGFWANMDCKTDLELEKNSNSSCWDSAGGTWTLFGNSSNNKKSGCMGNQLAFSLNAKQKHVECTNKAAWNVVLAGYEMGASAAELLEKLKAWLNVAAAFALPLAGAQGQAAAPLQKAANELLDFIIKEIDGNKRVGPVYLTGLNGPNQYTGDANNLFATVQTQIEPLPGWICVPVVGQVGGVAVTTAISSYTSTALTTTTRTTTGEAVLYDRVGEHGEDPQHLFGTGGRYAAERYAAAEELVDFFDGAFGLSIGCESEVPPEEAPEQPESEEAESDECDPLAQDQHRLDAIRTLGNLLLIPLQGAIDEALAAPDRVESAVLLDAQEKQSQAALLIQSAVDNADPELLREALPLLADGIEPLLDDLHEEEPQDSGDTTSTDSPGAGNAALLLVVGVVAGILVVRRRSPRS